MEGYLEEASVLPTPVKGTLATRSDEQKTVVRENMCGRAAGEKKSDPGPLAGRTHFS